MAIDDRLARAVRALVRLDPPPDPAAGPRHYRPVGRRSVITTYSSYAFREYARAQVNYADSVLIRHAPDRVGLCRCGRTHPCRDREHWQAMRAHDVRHVGEPSTWPASVGPYVPRPAGQRQRRRTPREGSR